MNVIQAGKAMLKARQAQKKLKEVTAIGKSKSGKVAVLLNGLQELEEVKLLVGLDEFSGAGELEKDFVQAFNAARKDLEPKLSESMDLDSLKDLLAA